MTRLTDNESANSEQVEAEALELMEELGLQGQLDRATNHDDVQTLNPFEPLKQNQGDAVKRYFRDNYCDPENYKGATMPLEVLKLFKIAKDSGHFKEFRLFYEKDYDPDPVLIGYTEGVYRAGSAHLIARWGDALLPWIEFIEAAKQRHNEACQQACLKIQEQVKSKLAQFEAGVDYPLDQNIPSTYL